MTQSLTGTRMGFLVAGPMTDCHYAIPSVSILHFANYSAKGWAQRSRSAVAPEHMLLGFVIWDGCPLASTSQPGCCDTLAADSQSPGLMLSSCHLGTPRSRVWSP